MGSRVRLVADLRGHARLGSDADGRERSRLVELGAEQVDHVPLGAIRLEQRLVMVRRRIRLVPDLDWHARLGGPDRCERSGTVVIRPTEHARPSAVTPSIYLVAAPRCAALSPAMEQLFCFFRNDRNILCRKKTPVQCRFVCVPAPPRCLFTVLNCPEIPD